jgi:hypothetical protein
MQRMVAHCSGLDPQDVGHGMAERSEHDPGDPAPAEGEYEMLNIFGSPTDVRVNLMQGNHSRQPRAGTNGRWLERHAIDC